MKIREYIAVPVSFKRRLKRVGLGEGPIESRVAAI